MPSFLERKLAVGKAEPYGLDLMGVSQREARETAQRFSRTVAHQEGGSPGAGRRASGVPSPSCQRHDTSPKGGGETRLCASFWRRTYLAPPLGELSPLGD